MKTRLITSAVGIVVCVAVFLLSEFVPIVSIIIISMVTALMCGEFLSAKGLHKNMLIFIPSLLYSFSMPMLVITSARLIPLYVYALIMVVFTVVFHSKIHTDDLFFAFGGVSVITLSLSAMVYRSLGGEGHASFWLILCLAIPWLADSAAYFAGSAFGKKKLCPVISPKKTVEGAVVGVISGALSSLLVGLLFLLIYGDVKINFVILAVLGLVNSVISIFGDLIFSVIKRHCDIKDYGTIMPGHGGMLDRFDSVIFCIPMVLIVSQYVEIIA